MLVKIVQRTKVEELSELLAVQSRRVRELESKLQQEKQERANLMCDFQHLLDQINHRPGFASERL